MSVNTINYYDVNAKDYAAWTANVNFRKVQDKFMIRLNPGAEILDFGCGSGRDSACFLENGFSVTAMDGSAKMAETAKERTGLAVQHRMFQDLDEKDCYDGIWACASILHLKKDELEDVLFHMGEAIRRNGIIYASFKYGDFEGERDGRYYTDMTVGSFQKLLKKVPILEIDEAWTTEDARVDRDGLWLNLLLVRKDRDMLY